jgi:hypothetical protein
MQQSPEKEGEIGNGHKPFVYKKGRMEKELIDMNLALIKIQRIKL